jgi:hypothetical protein
MAGAGEGNRTLVCSLGSWTFPISDNALAAKPSKSRPFCINGLRSVCKTDGDRFAATATGQTQPAPRTWNERPHPHAESHALPSKSHASAHPNLQRPRCDQRVYSALGRHPRSPYRPAAHGVLIGKTPLLPYSGVFVVGGVYLPIERTGAQV